MPGSHTQAQAPRDAIGEEIAGIPRGECTAKPPEMVAQLVQKSRGRGSLSVLFLLRRQPREPNFPVPSVPTKDIHRASKGVGRGALYSVATHAFSFCCNDGWA